MADIRKLAPILLKWEAGAPKQETLEEQWRIAQKKGYSNHPADKGGPTMCGITLKTYKKYRSDACKNEPTVDDLKKITLDEWLAVLKRYYWDKMKADRINNQSIADLCVDNVWGSGPGYIKVIQREIGVVADGIVGNVTLAAINGHKDPEELFNRLWNRRKMYYVNLIVARPANKAFERGWMNRLYDFKYRKEE